VSTVNKAIIVGHLGRDPEARSTKGGGTVVTLSVATTHRRKDADDETEWHRVTVFGQQAEACERYLAKGRLVYVEGRLRTSSYEKDGIKRYSTEIIANTVQFLGGKGDGSGKRDGEPRDSGPEPYGYDGGDDDIPF